MSNKYISLILTAVSIAAVSVSSVAYSQNIAIVNGKAIPKSKLEQIINEVPGAKESKDIQDKIKTTLIDRELMLQEAYKRNLLSLPKVKLQIEEMRNAVLVGTVLDDYLNNSINDAELKKYYELFAKNTSGKQYKSKHILVATEAEANAILASIQQGKKFEDLAKEKSMDTGSGAQGGDLNWNKPDIFVPEFASALVALNKGETSKKSVKTQFGYHIIRLDDVKEGVAPSMAEVKPQIIEMLKNNPEWQKSKLDELRKTLRAKAKIQ
jgi:peptidyl-prolyl cis-trans isomerase C